MQTSNNIYLFMVSFNIKYPIYIVELEAIKGSAGRRVLLSRCQVIAEAASPMRDKNKEQEADHSSPL
jgi:ABC-type phosphate transport system substrate-binding protein